VDLSKARIEGLLAAFPKLMGTGKQHTFIETDSVRYLYQPMEALYMLVITNKNSNILEVEMGERERKEKKRDEVRGIVCTYINMHALIANNDLDKGGEDHSTDRTI
jgi:hypothetical protein